MFVHALINIAISYNCIVAIGLLTDSLVFGENFLHNNRLDEHAEIRCSLNQKCSVSDFSLKFQLGQETAEKNIDCLKRPSDR